jgi:hypothetical protein
MNNSVTKLFGSFCVLAVSVCLFVRVANLNHHEARSKPVGGKHSIFETAVEQSGGNEYWTPRYASGRAVLVSADSQVIIEGTLQIDAVFSFSKEIMRKYHNFAMTDATAYAADMKAACESRTILINRDQMISHVRVVDMDNEGLIKVLTDAGIPIWTLRNYVVYQEAEEAEPSPSPAMIPAPPLPWPVSVPKATPVPASALSTPKGFNGDVVDIKLFLNQTLEAWKKCYGNNGIPENAGFEYTWYVGRFKLHVSFDRRLHKADSVSLSAQPCKPALTLDEAKKVMASLGLKNFQPINNTNSCSWGHEDGAVYASYAGGASDDHRLSIQTSLFYEGGFISD